METKEKIKFLWDILKRYDSYIGVANTKASLILSFCIAILSGLLLKSNEIISQVEIENLKKVIPVLLIIIALMLIKTIYHALKTVFPNTTSYTAGLSVIFFGDVANIETCASGYHKKVNQLTEEDAIQDLSFQIYELALITSNKFSELKKSIQSAILLIPLFFLLILVVIF